ncbi:MAG: ABC transporter permease, partial [Deltaproteobacteria bacterium]|nr:ABC transporter permease [Deltaproteobacteria bacterium]
MSGLKGLYREYESTIIGTAFILLVLLLWQMIPVVMTLSKGMTLFFTTPSQIVRTFFVLIEQGELQRNFYVSATEFIIGLGLSIAVGLPLGIVVGRSPVLNALFDPFITAFNATPRLVFLPLILLWLGIGIWSKIVIVFIGALFPLLINTYEGVRNVDRVLVNVVRSFGAKEWQVMKMVVLPNSLPYVITGLRLAIGRAILG